MKEMNSVLRNEDKAVLSLRTLYQSYGYAQYKMSKFEEYDLYVRNKSFLVSDHVITFTDTNGKLMALKPDVTLSIVKNSKDLPDSVQKVYYDEKVYRAYGGDYSFREIPQVGLECLGEIDDYCLLEVVSLAAQSLSCISEDFVLDISHLGLLSAVLSEMALSGQVRGELISCIGEKNRHGIREICLREGVSEDATDAIITLVDTYGSPERVLPVLRKRFSTGEAAEALEQLSTLCAALAERFSNEKIRLDFSVVSDLSYYNGIVFKGFINGISSDVLSGGQYDKLMQKMGKRAGAVGFAVYLDLLEELFRNERNEYDVDVLLVYDGTSSSLEVNRKVEALVAEGKSVTAQRSVPEKLRYRTLCRMGEKGE